MLNRKVRNIGLCEALVNFTKTFNPDRQCQAVHTDRKRQVFLEPEPNVWMVLVGLPYLQAVQRRLKSVFLEHFFIGFFLFSVLQTVSIPWVELINNGERTVQYSRDHVQVRDWTSSKELTTPDFSFCRMKCLKLLWRGLTTCSRCGIFPFVHTQIVTTFIIHSPSISSSTAHILISLHSLEWRD